MQPYAEREKIRAELLASSPGGEETSLAYTVPVELIFQTLDALIVDPVDDGTRLMWTLDARMVHAVRSSLEGMTGP